MSFFPGTLGGLSVGFTTESVANNNGTNILPLQWKFRIGPLELSRFEVPAEFEIGYEQKIAVHDYISSKGAPERRTHKFGAFPTPTKWTATLFGINALHRFQQLEALALGQRPVRFIYGPLEYLVDVKQVLGKIKHQLEIDYTIELVVIRSEGANVPKGRAPATFDVEAQGFYDDGTNAATIVHTDPSVPLSLVASYNDMLNTLGTSYPVSGLSIDGLNTAIAKIAVYTTALTAFLLPLRGQAPVEASVTLLQNGQQALSNLTRLKQNLQKMTGANPSPGLQTINVTSGNLFLLAAQFYPQLPTDQGAQLLAAANNLSDFWIKSSTDLVIPPVGA